MTRRKETQRLPPFVPLLKETMDAPAWHAMSHGARSLYIALKRRHIAGSNNNGRVYLSQRNAEKEVGSDTNQITRWYRELQHYGFIVQTRGPTLGVNGKGKAPHWRLTEIAYLYNRSTHGADSEPGLGDGGQPTRDFLRWNGIKFRNKEKKQNPVRESTDTPSVKSRTPLSVNSRTPSKPTVRESTDIQRDMGVRENTDITRFTTTANQPTLARASVSTSFRPGKRLM